MVLLEDFKNDAFVVSELFESSFNGLIGVYSRCSTGERWGNNPQKALLDKWNLRMIEVANIKQNTSKKDNWENMYNLVQSLKPELERMEKLEEERYFYPPGQSE
jgi:hypothetical protein